MPNRPPIGDVFEFRTPCGRAYFQVANQHPEYGSLIRILPGLFGEADPDLMALVAGPERFLAFYPAAAAARAGLAKHVAKVEVPDQARLFPMMRWPLGGDGHRNGWALWDGSREVGRVRTLGEEHVSLPEPGIWDHQTLVDRTASDWSWADAAEAPPWRQLRRPAGCEDPDEQETAEGEEQLVTHYLYLPDSRSASRAKKRLSRHAGAVEIRPSALGDQLLVLYRHDPATNPESLRAELERLALDLGGEYDGWEAPVD